MKKKFLNKKVLAVLMLVVLLVGIYLAYENYSIDYSDLTSLEATEFLTPEVIADSLPESLMGKNIFGVETPFEVSYDISFSEPSEPESIFLDVVTKDSIAKLPNKAVTVKFSANNKTQSITVYSKLTDEEYAHYANIYTMDYSNITAFKEQSYSFTSKILETFPQDVIGQNIFGDKKSFNVIYKINSEVINPKDEKIMLDALNKDNIKLNNDKADILFSANNDDFQTLSFYVFFDNIYVKPIILNSSLVKEPISLTVTSRDVLTEFKIPLPFSEEELNEMFNSKKSRLTKMVGNKRIEVLNEMFVDIKESDMFDLILKDNSLDATKYKNAYKDAFDSLPYELKEYAVYSGLRLLGNDFTKNVDTYVSNFKTYYNQDITVEEYIYSIGGFYSVGTKDITMNTNPKFWLNTSRYNFNKYTYTYDLDEYESKFLYNGKKQLVISNKTELNAFFSHKYKNTLIHEFMHYLDYGVRTTAESNMNDKWFSHEIMDILRPIVDGLGYNYDNNNDSEFLAYSAEAYFSHPEYLNSKSPKIFNIIETIMSELDYSEVNEFKELVKQARN